MWIYKNLTFLGCQRYDSFALAELQDSLDGLRDAQVIQAEPPQSSSAPKVKLDLYYDPKAKDFRLLMNLLAETSGLSYALRILTVFDKDLQRQWRAKYGSL